MTPHDRVLILIGGSALFASLAIGGVFAATNDTDALLRRDEATAQHLQVLATDLLTTVHEQNEALDEYLLSADPRPLTRYTDAATEEQAIAAQIRAESGGLSGVADALANVETQSDTWRTSVAAPLIAAVTSGTAEELKAAIIKEIVDLEVGQAATGNFVQQLNGLHVALAVRSDELGSLRIEAVTIGVIIELVAAALSLWFVRRFGLTVAGDARRRARMSAERLEIIASLRTLRTLSTPESTASSIADALFLLPGVDVAGVFECTDDAIRALAVVGPADFPIRLGETVPESHARHLRERSEEGPWAETPVGRDGSGSFDDQIAALGIKSRAFGPIHAGGELVGLVGLATTDENHGRHFLDDLPAVAEFASVAEAILAPALLARRTRTTERRRIETTIAAQAFHPVFQAVVDLATNRVVGFEALTRFDDGSRPDLMFAAASECGLGVELETATLEASIGESRRLPPDAWLSLNVSPTLVTRGQVLDRLLAAIGRSIVLEVTEHELISAYAPLRAELLLLLGPDVRLAVDDAGAGVANFNHLVELAPDFVKIDAGLIRGCDTDARRRAVVAGLIHYAADARCQVIAEGIETDAERHTVSALGVTLGQGFLLGRPALASTLTERSCPIPADTLRRLPSVVGAALSGPAGRAGRVKVIPA